MMNASRRSFVQGLLALPVALVVAPAHSHSLKKLRRDLEAAATPIYTGPFTADNLLLGFSEEERAEFLKGDPNET